MGVLALVFGVKPIALFGAGSPVDMKNSWQRAGRLIGARLTITAAVHLSVAVRNRSCDRSSPVVFVARGYQMRMPLPTAVDRDVLARDHT